MNAEGGQYEGACRQYLALQRLARATEPWVTLVHGPPVVFQMEVPPRRRCAVKLSSCIYKSYWRNCSRRKLLKWNYVAGVSRSTSRPEHTLPAWTSSPDATILHLLSVISSGSRAMCEAGHTPHTPHTLLDMISLTPHNIPVSLSQLNYANPIPKQRQSGTDRWEDLQRGKSMNQH
jgi:hypothetical protein